MALIPSKERVMTQNYGRGDHVLPYLDRIQRGELCMKGRVPRKFLKPSPIVTTFKEGNGPVESMYVSLRHFHASQREVSQIIDHVVCAHDLVPRIDHLPVHFLSRGKRTITETNNVPVTEMMICSKKRLQFLILLRIGRPFLLSFTSYSSGTEERAPSFSILLKK